MTKVNVLRCDMCGATGETMPSATIRISTTEELRFHICEEDIANNFGELEPYPRRRSRAVEGEA